MLHSNLCVLTTVTISKGGGLQVNAFKPYLK